MKVLTKDKVKKLLPKRTQESNKSTYGKVLTITGSKKYSGAGYLCAKAASVCGCGYSFISAPESLESIYCAYDPEILFVPLVQSIHGNLCIDSIMNLNDFNAVVIGPGIDVQNETIEYVEEFFIRNRDANFPIIIDADALNCLSKITGFVLPENSVITPHPLELSRLLNVDVEVIQQDRLKYTQRAAEKFDTNVILKGNKTVIVLKNFESYINKTGNSALAKSGSGDVLSGIIAGFAAQGQSIGNSSLIAVYLHGLSSEIYSNKYSEYSMTMKDLIENLPLAIKEILL